MLTEAPSRPVDTHRIADDRPHAVVIGSGFGGLAAAIRLGAKGYRVTVLEKLDAPGGRAYVFRQDGFVFDAGPTIITAPFLFEELWQLCGRRLEDDVKLVKLDPFYEIHFADGTIFTCSDDPERMRAEVAKCNSADVAGYERLMELSEEIFRIGFLELGDKPFGSLWDMAKVAPGLIRLRADRSVHAFVSKHVKDERVRAALSFHPLFIGGSPFEATSIYHLIAFLERKWGVHFVMGGTGALVQGLVGLIEGQGGAVRYHQEVASITVKDGRATGVTLSDGEAIRADVVVSNADSAWTYQKLLPASARRRWTDKKLGKARYSNSLFVWYFGTTRRYDDVGHHTILMGPRYEGLIRDIFKNKVLADDFSVYLHRPTATDPSLAPEGCDAFYVLSPVPHLDADIDWATMAEPYRQKIAAFLQEKLLPGLDEAVVASHVVTPPDFLHRLNSIKGAAFGLEPILLQSAWFRPHNRSEDVDRLYLVGAGTHPGAGVPGVVSSARILDTVVPDAALVVRS
ncbi:MAG: phytoene desaturase [Pseudomonadota bacterium]